MTTPQHAHAIAKTRLIVALDTPTVEQATGVIDELQGYVGFWKLGLQLQPLITPALWRTLKHQNAGLFVDFKWHDIPRTVAAAVESLCTTGAELATLHITDEATLLAAVAARDASTPRHNHQRLRLLGITVLTSVGTSPDTRQKVIQRTQLALDVGLDGVVLAAPDLPSVHEALTIPDSFLRVCPGIRASAQRLPHDDQSRISSASQAIQEGATHVVVGRSILAHPSSEQRQHAARQILEDLTEGLNATRSKPTVD